MHYENDFQVIDSSIKYFRSLNFNMFSVIEKINFCKWKLKLMKTSYV